MSTLNGRPLPRRRVLELSLWKEEACIIHMRNWIKTFWLNCWQHRLPLSNHFLGLRFAWFLLVAIFSYAEAENPIEPHILHTCEAGEMAKQVPGATNHIAGIGPRNLAHNPFKCLRQAESWLGTDWMRLRIWFQQSFRRFFLFSFSLSFFCVSFAFAVFR